MQLAIAAIGKVFGGLASVAGASGGAGAAAAGTAGAGGFSAASLFTAGLGILGQIGSGIAAKNQAENMAAQADLTAGQEHLQSTQRQTAMKRQLLQVLGENDVTFASAGIDISGGGIAQSAAADAKKRAAQEISIDRNDADFRRATYRLKAQGYRQQGRSALGGALLGALGTGIKTGLDIRAIGGGGGGAADPWGGLRTVG